MPEPVMLANRQPPPLRPMATAVELTGSSAAISRVDELIRRVAALEAPCLLTARRGCDADSIARDIHRRSARSAAAFVAVSCGATAIERTLLGEPAGQPPSD